PDLRFAAPSRLSGSSPLAALAQRMVLRSKLVERKEAGVSKSSSSAWTKTSWLRSAGKFGMGRVEETVPEAGTWSVPGKATAKVGSSAHHPNGGRWRSWRTKPTAYVTS